MFLLLIVNTNFYWLFIDLTYSGLLSVKLAFLHFCNFLLILKYRSNNNIGANKIGIVPDSHFKIFEPIVDLELDS